MSANIRHFKACLDHLSADLSVGANNNSIATLTERQSRLVMLAMIANNGTQSAITAVIRQPRKLRGALYRSLTWGLGSEITDHVAFALATKIDVCFCYPQSPWQRTPMNDT